MNPGRRSSDSTDSVKQRVLAELKAYAVISLYLWVILGSFTVYRRLILAESGVTYLHYGIALIEALIIAKVILVGRLFGFSRRFEDKPLIVPVIYKSALFGVLVLLFGLVEHIVDGLIHKQGLMGGLRAIRMVGAYELAARTLILVSSLVPFIAFGEISRVLGGSRLADMFFSPRAASEETQSSA